MASVYVSKKTQYEKLTVKRNKNKLSTKHLHEANMLHGTKKPEQHHVLGN